MGKRFFSFLTIILSLASIIEAYANDSAYFTSGSQLVPLDETNIAIRKEILTISICDDSYASVDVYYEFYNPDSTRTILMGFEADSPGGAVEYLNPISPSGEHPYISDFSVTVNNEKLTYKNAISLPMTDGKLHPVGPPQWKFGEGGGIINVNDSDVVLGYSCVYYFNATFAHGLNVVHHTYRYKLEASVIYSYALTYKLTPALRWAKHGIDDFTLRIKADNTAKDFIIDGTMYRGKWKIASGFGKARQRKYKEFVYDDSKDDYANAMQPCTEITLRNGAMEWHKLNFKPKQELNLYSADRVFAEEGTYNVLKGNNLGLYYDRFYGPHYNPEEYNKAERRIIRNLPYANRGYVFKDKKLRTYFNRFWWYMPDKSWKPSTRDFTKEEQEMIRQ